MSCEKEKYEGVLAVLSSFFKVLKGSQKDCKFIFVTGVTKFHLSGLTSGANSANDISLHEDYAEMLGYTDKDIEKLFFNDKHTYINTVIINLRENWYKGESYTDEQLKQELKDYYNGYCFSRNKGIKRMYNPDSILKFFRDKAFGNYWSNSGNPAILLQQIRNDINRFTIAWNKSSLAINKLDFENLAGSLSKIPLLPLMYQTGYLTLDPNGFKEDIREDKNATDYYLKFPNEEVRSALKSTLIKIMDEVQEETGKQYSTSILNTLRNKKWSVFLNYIRSDCLAKAGYRFLDKTERSFQRALYLFLNGVFHATHDMQTSAESDSGIGRTDIVMEDHRNDQRAVYIFELKIDRPALEALTQIHSKDYSIKYGSCSEKILIGITCDAAKLNITEAIVQVHQKDEQDNFREVVYTHFTVDQSGYFKEVINQ
ncbi:AAA family ATPase [Cardinium endosymbiont of Sogatella furcifera]|uniref:PD-(D/E)XK nuclease domain-containing protein n=1 Tax=Cardinium endosymbiont of Sogatella furcifera TaxID=650378 RepID=UPI001CB92CC2|nr:AAA family ATPase [Cardinium endosymbiont of Sogatella furcifera]